MIDFVSREKQFWLPVAIFSSARNDQLSSLWLLFREIEYFNAMNGVWLPN